MFVFPPPPTGTLKTEITQITESSPSYSCPPRIHPFNGVNAHSNCNFQQNLLLLSVNPSLISPRKEASLQRSQLGLSVLNNVPCCYHDAFNGSMAKFLTWMWTVPASSHTIIKCIHAVSLVISGPNICHSNPQSGNMTRYTIQTIQHLRDLSMDLDAMIPAYLANDKGWLGRICQFSYFNNACLYHQAVLKLNNICKILTTVSAAQQVVAIANTPVMFTIFIYVK